EEQPLGAGADERACGLDDVKSISKARIGVDEERNRQARGDGRRCVAESIEAEIAAIGRSHRRSGEGIAAQKDSLCAWALGEEGGWRIVNAGNDEGLFARRGQSLHARGIP